MHPPFLRPATAINSSPLKQRLQILQRLESRIQILQSSLPITLPGPLSPLRAADEPREGRDELEQAVAGAVHTRRHKSPLVSKNFPRVSISQGRNPWSSGEATFSAPKGLTIAVAVAVAVAVASLVCKVQN